MQLRGLGIFQAGNQSQSTCRVPQQLCERWLGQRGDQTIFSSVAILTAGVARNPIHPAAAARTGVSWAPRAPARALGDPADLGVADSAADPVTAILLLHHDLALRAVHGLALLQHGPQHFCRLPGSHIVLSPQGQVVLVLLTVHLLMNGLAKQAVDVETHGAGELIDIILKEAPPLAVRCLAVVAEGTSILGNGDA